MSATSVSARRDRLGAIGWGAGVVAVALATVASGVAGGGNLLVTIAPVLLVTGALLVVNVPLRWPATSLVFLLLAADRREDAAGIWSTPLAPLGQFLADSSALGIFAGFEVLALLLIGLALYRRAVGSTLDGREPDRMATAARDLTLLYLAGLGYAVAVGAFQGVPLSPWKVRYILHVPLLFVLFHLAFRNVRDLAPVGRAIVVAAHVKALLAAWIQYVVAPELTGGQLAYATNHGDSVLFVAAILIVLARAMERTNPRNVLAAVLLLPVPIWGMILNQRRIAWAMLEMSLLVFYVVSPWRPWKRRLTTSLLVAAPLVLLYVGIGWNSPGGGFFGPVHKVRTLLDSSVDASTFWRDVEAWNIASTIRDRSFLGIGLGGEYVEYMKNDDISAGYADYRGWPHNTILGLILYAGVFGSMALWLLYPGTMFLAVRGYRHAASHRDRTAALVCVGAVVSCFMMAWGDTGQHFTQVKLALALALAVAGKVAVSTGAWGRSRDGGAPPAGEADATGPEQARERVSAPRTRA